MVTQARGYLTLRVPIPRRLSIFSVVSLVAILLLVWAFIGGLQLALQLHVFLRALSLFLAALPSMALFGILAVRDIVQSFLR